MPSKAKNLSKLIYALLALTMAASTTSCTNQASDKKKHLSGRQILDKMYLEFILNEDFDALYTATETAAELPTPYSPYTLETVPLKQPLLLTIKNKKGTTLGIETQIDGTLPENFDLPPSSSKSRCYLILHTSTKRLADKYGTLTTPLRLEGPGNHAKQFSATHTITRSYKDSAVEFINPTPHAIYSGPFPHPNKPSEECVFVALQFTRRSSHELPANTLHYGCSQLVLLPYSHEELENVLKKTKSYDPIHKVAQNLLKQMNPPLRN